LVCHIKRSQSKDFENRVLRTRRPKREEVIEPSRKLHDEELHILYYSPSNINRLIKSRRLRSTGHVTRMGEKKNAEKILVEKPDRYYFQRARCRFEDNIKKDPEEIGRDCKQ
jgi:hypothetical protein